MHALLLENLSKTYANGFTALDNINLAVPEGEFFALLGANGAGKSTMIGIVSALFAPTNGTVQIFGVDLHKNPTVAKSMLGVVPQEFNFMQFERVIDILVVQAGYFGISAKVATPRAEYLLSELGLFDKRFEKARALSGGMKRRVMIARALMHHPRLLILDEPTAGVDISLRHSMWEFMQKINQDEGVSIILTTHYLEEAEQLCKNIAILERGKIAIDTSMKELLARLDKQSFVLDLQNPLQSVDLPAKFVATLLDPLSLQVTLQKGQSLNEVFLLLHAQGVQVMSLRNKANRLEELFLSMQHSEAHA